MQEDSCLPDQTSVHEDLADKVPLAHDDLGCPIRRDRLYQQENMVAKAKPLSGPPVSPNLFRSPRSSAPERPSPKAIQASIKESATLAAAISMQWKEEVSAMRRELAELRRDLCKELRAFNTNFNTFTQHYNTWSPQGANMPAGSAQGRGAGGAEAGGFPAAGTDRATGGARDKKPQVDKVSVGTQSRSKVLVRQSTADAAVNCPEEKETMKMSRRNLPKQLSMDPSILACPQSMYVESAIPLSLDPILPGSAKAAQPEPLECSDVPSRAKAKPQPKLPDQCVMISSNLVTYEPVAPLCSEIVSLERANECPLKPVAVEQNMSTNTSTAVKYHSASEPAHLEDVEPPDSHPLTEREKTHLPYPVPVVTVSPPEEHDRDTTSDSDFTYPVTWINPTAVCSTTTGPDKMNSTEPTKLEATLSEKQSTFASVDESCLVWDAPTDVDIATCHTETDNKCPAIVVSEYLGTDSPASPTDSDIGPIPIVTLPDYPCNLLSEQTPSDVACSSAKTQPNADAESKDSEWPPLPEPLDTTPIYHADLVHFDVVMLTSLDQDDLDSVFMDAEPDPFDLSLDSPSNLDSHSPFDCPNSPLPIDDPATHFHLGPSESVHLDPALEYFLPQVPQDGSSVSQKAPLSQVTVTISPPSSVSPDTSLEIDFGPTSPAPYPPSPETDPLSSDVEDVAHASADQACTNPEPVEQTDLSHEYEKPVEEKTEGSPGRSPHEEAFLWYRWQKRAQRKESLPRSSSVELWSGRYEYNSAEITYVSLTL